MPSKRAERPYVSGAAACRRTRPGYNNLSAAAANPHGAPEGRGPTMGDGRPRDSPIIFPVRIGRRRRCGAAKRRE